jgi:hypothetical protein
MNHGSSSYYESYDPTLEIFGLFTSDWKQDIRICEVDRNFYGPSDWFCSRQKMFQQFEFYQLQTTQSLDNILQACDSNVCLTILHIEEIFIPFNNCNLEGDVSSICF